MDMVNENVKIFLARELKSELDSFLSLELNTRLEFEKEILKRRNESWKFLKKFQENGSVYSESAQKDFVNYIFTVVNFDKMKEDDDYCREVIADIRHFLNSKIHFISIKIAACLPRILKGRNSIDDAYEVCEELSYSLMNQSFYTNNDATEVESAYFEFLKSLRSFCIKSFCNKNHFELDKNRIENYLRDYFIESSQKPIGSSVGINFLDIHPKK